MRRRSRAGDKPVKTRRGKTMTRKRRSGQKAVRGRSPSVAGEGTKLARVRRELNEALEQQAATSEVLGVISSSRGELQPVFDAMLANAVRICEAGFGNLLLVEDGAFRHVAFHGTPREYVEKRLRQPTFLARPGSDLDRLMKTKRIVHVADLVAEGAADSSAIVDLAGARSIVTVPMLKDNKLIGAIGIFRQEVRPFTNKQIELLTTLAAQAVIAIENTRLLNELRQSLHQQTATADVLKVISRSTFDLKIVLDTLVQSAVRLCDAECAHIFRFTENIYRLAACCGYSPEYEEYMYEQRISPGRHTLIGRIALEGQMVHIPDVLADPDYQWLEAQKLGQWRTMLGVPLLREGTPIGALSITRSTVRPFTEKQIELLATFADQAVIAIENVRLFEAEQQRSRELSEALEQQTATSEVLKVISSSPGELEPVFQAMLENAVRICEAKFGVMHRFDEDAIYPVAMLDIPPALIEFLRQRGRAKPIPGSDIDSLWKSKQVVHTIDMLQSQVPSPPARLAGARTQLAVPMLKNDELVGAVVIYRQEVRPFTGKQIELVQNFAAQAVIAIENTRLLNELRQSLEQQTATAEVLGVISNSLGELEPVFRVMLENATRICGASFGVLFLAEGQAYRSVALYGATPEFAEARQREPLIKPNPATTVGRVALTKQAVQVADIQADPGFRSDPERLARLTLAGARTMLNVPMLKEGEVVGQFAIYRDEVRPFTEKQIDLVRNFAAQAVIAIENTRLLNELRQRTDDLSKSLNDLRSAQDRLVQTEKLASLGQLTAGIAHEIKNPLNFVNNFSAVSVELIDELRGALEGAHLDDGLRAEIGEIADALQGNLDKVVQHGRRADAIVKNMLLHSRQGSGEHRPVDINALVEESLNLAYHGARAEKQGFEITLERSFDPAAGEVDVFPQEITRALLNLISNGFYAVMKHKVEADGGDYEPALTAATKNFG